MRTLKAICAAAILALALSVSAYGGDVSTPGAPAPVPGHVSTLGVVPTNPGDIQTPGEVSTAPGDIGMPGFADILLALVSMF